jgi:hypothetical protein
MKLLNQGFDHVEFAVGTIAPHQLTWEKMGFEKIADLKVSSKGARQVVMAQGSVRLLLTEYDGSKEAQAQEGYRFLKAHGDGICVLAAEVEDSAATFHEVGRWIVPLEARSLPCHPQSGITHDVLTSKGEIMRQASENTAAIQLEAMKNKECLQHAINSTYDKLSALNTDRLRDNLNDYRAEATGLRYGDEYGHRHDIHNNLYSNFGREHREREGFPGPPR